MFLIRQSRGVEGEVFIFISATLTRIYLFLEDIICTGSTDILSGKATTLYSAMPVCLSKGYKWSIYPGALLSCVPDRS